VLAYAFLAGGAVHPLSGFAWPTPSDGGEGPWVTVEAAPAEALRGYPAGDLQYWFDDELWTVELAGMLAERDHLLLAERARLLGRVDAWNEPLAWEFVNECARRVARPAAQVLREDGRTEAAARLDGAGDLRELEQAAAAAAQRAPLAGFAADVCFYALDARLGVRAAGVAAKMSAYALATNAGTAAERDERVQRERAWQADWLAQRLGL
jgi:hypothetical protein